LEKEEMNMPIPIVLPPKVRKERGCPVKKSIDIKQIRMDKEVNGKLIYTSETEVLNFNPEGCYTIKPNSRKTITYKNENGLDNKNKFPFHTEKIEISEY
jgi:hypothetical protein